MFEIIFITSIIVRFLSEYTPEGEVNPVRSFKKIASRYFKGRFAVDLLMVIPFYYILNDQIEEAKLFFFLKAYRIVQGLKTFNVAQIMIKVKE